MFLYGNEQETKHEIAESIVKTTVKIYGKEKKKRFCKAAYCSSVVKTTEKVGGFPSITVNTKQ